jgi:hypothetical protein
MKPRAIVKFNGGVPIALCNRCFIIMCYVSCTEETGDECVVKTSNFDHEGNICTTVAKGEPVPIYCDKCKNLLSYSLNE